ncbi:MAG: hypothetical protein IT380_16755 [Myxococcales bacterium]|nr:hypothetical protein [Myxococcales bacterium]
MDRLQQLLEDGVIDEVYSQLKTGKEAEVWLVSHRGEPVAAKLYKDRDTRSFKNDVGYKEGRAVRNTRTQRAMDRGSRFGRVAAEDAWKSAEADAMFALHAAGVHVPKPVLFYEGVLLMEVIGDAEGRVAPRLADVGLGREQAGPLYRRLRGDVIRMLAADWIHADLSEFNVLLGVQGPVLIDFPQVVTAAKNSRSEHYFRRDLGNLLRFFSGIDPSLARHGRDADDIWRAYVRRHLTPDYEPDRPQHAARGGLSRHSETHLRGEPRGTQGWGDSRAPEGGPRARREAQRNREDSTQRQPQRGNDAQSAQHTPSAAKGHPPGRAEPQPPRRDSPSGSGGPRGPRRGPDVVFKHAAGPASSPHPPSRRGAGPPRRF